MVHRSAPHESTDKKEAKDIKRANLVVVYIIQDISYYEVFKRIMM